MKAVIAVIAGSIHQYRDYVREMVEVSNKWQHGEDILTKEGFKRVKSFEDCSGLYFSQVIVIGTYWKTRNYTDLILECKQREKRWKAL